MCKADFIIIWKRIKSLYILFSTIVTIIHHKEHVFLIYSITATNPFLLTLLNTWVMN